MGRRLRRFGVTAALAVLLLGGAALFVRQTVGWVFPISTGSMAPTLLPGDWVFVRYDRDLPEMHELAVVAEADGGATVKRVAALPGQSVRIDAAGDVRIEGRLRERPPDRPELIPVFDSRLQSIDAYWAHGQGNDPRMAFDPWERRTPEGPGEVWHLDGRGVERNSDVGLLRYRARVVDGWLDASGAVVQGTDPVHDVAVEFDVRVLDVGGYLRVQLTEQGDVFSAIVPLYANTEVADVYIERVELEGPYNPNPRRTFLSRGQVRIRTGSWVHVRFSNVDNRLRFEVDDQLVEADYGDRNTPHPEAPGNRPFSVGERVRLGASGLSLDVRDVRVLRDLHYAPTGTFGIGPAHPLGPDEIYLLGDASRNSLDSRQRGPFPVQSVVGRVEAVVWPPSRARGL